MDLWLRIYMAVVALLLPSLMIYLGDRFVKKPPKTANCLFGYRTARSMKNQRTWDFAHQYCGRFWVRWGRSTLVVSVVVLACIWDAPESCVSLSITWLILAQLIPLLTVIPATEAALKREFPLH